MARTLVLLRHGESEWNLKNLFTGWYDCDLTATGEAQAIAGGRLMAERGFLPDVVHTSVLVRAIRTADLALREMGRTWIPVRRHCRPSWYPTPSAWPTWSTACCPTGTTPSSLTWPTPRSCWCRPTATVCGRW